VYTTSGCASPFTSLCDTCRRTSGLYLVRESLSNPHVQRNYVELKATSTPGDAHMSTHHHSRLATGLLVATALLGTACSDATSSDPASSNPTSSISATPSYSRSSHDGSRSEERRVGKECRCGWVPDH